MDSLVINSRKDESISSDGLCLLIYAAVFQVAHTISLRIDFISNAEAQRRRGSAMERKQRHSS